MARQASVLALSSLNLEVPLILGMLLLALLVSAVAAVRPPYDALEDPIQAETLHEHQEKADQVSMEARSTSLTGSQTRAEFSAETDSEEAGATDLHRQLQELLNEYDQPSHSVNDKHNPSLPSLHPSQTP